jgi:hypothetical protein
MNEAASQCLIFYFVSLSSRHGEKGIIDSQNSAQRKRQVWLSDEAQRYLFEEQAIEHTLTSTILERNHSE